MRPVGISGCSDLADRTMRAFDRLEQGIAAMPELRMLGDPQRLLLGDASRDPDVSISAVGDPMDARAWHVNRPQFPEGLHAMVPAKHLECVDAFLADLKDAIAVVKADPSLARRDDVWIARQALPAAGRTCWSSPPFRLISHRLCHAAFQRG